MKIVIRAHEQLDFEHFHKWSYFPYWMTAKDAITNLLKLDPLLKQAYTVLNHVQTALQHQDWTNPFGTPQIVLKKYLGHLKYYRRTIMQFITPS